MLFGQTLILRPDRVSSQVDVWAAGVVVYQMLFGRRPFGEGCSQEAILRDGVILNAREVAFPPKPAVSAEARDFITRRGPPHSPMPCLLRGDDTIVRNFSNLACPAAEPVASMRPGPSSLAC